MRLVNAKSSNYRPEIDGLRAVAVLSVILFHAGFAAFRGGFFGVDIFFVISGYLITSNLIAEKRAGRFSFIAFYERRMRRILPALICVLLFCVPLIWIMAVPSELYRFSKAYMAIAVFGSNIFFKTNTNYFSSEGDLDPLIHTWSLGVEEQFYLVFPLLFIGVWKAGRGKLILWIGTLALLSYALQLWWSGRNDFLASFYLTPSRAWQLLIGSLGAFAPVIRSKGWSEIASGVAILSLARAILFYSGGESSLVFLSVIPTMATLALLVSGPNRVNTILSQRWLVGIGLISYSTYLWHQPVFAFSRMYALNPLTKEFLSGLVFLTLILGYITWRFVEVPFRKSSFISSKKFLTAAVCGTVLVGALGLTGYLNEAFIYRFEHRELLMLASPDVMSAKCHERLGIETLRTGQTCVLGDRSKPVSVALIGDSHAGSLSTALEEFAARSSFSFTIMTDGWCVPFLGVSNPSNPKCREFIDEALAMVARAPSIETVILYAEWSAYTEGFRFGSVPVAYFDSQSTEKTVAKNPEVFARGLARTVAYLRDHRKNVLLIGPVPEHPIRVRDTLARASKLSRTSIRLEATTGAQFARRNQFVNNELRRPRDGVAVLDVETLFCTTPEVSCALVDDNGMPLYSDGNHLTLYGARRVVSRLPPLLVRKEK